MRRGTAVRYRFLEPPTISILQMKPVFLRLTMVGLFLLAVGACVSRSPGSVHRAGGRIVGGSDWWVSSLNPLDAIEVAVRRQNPNGTGGSTLNPMERIDLATMLAAYTINGAYLMRQEDRLGSIEVGKRADLIVLDRNLFEALPTEINEARVLSTLFDGEDVFSSAAMP